MILELDTTAARPVYLQIADGIRRAILAGEISPGDRLPPGRELAASVDVNLETVQRAYRDLAESGIVVSRVGRGTTVSESVDLEELGVRPLVDALIDRSRRLGIDDRRLVELLETRLTSPDDKA